MPPPPRVKGMIQLPPRLPKVKPYYDHGGITIYHGSCLEVLKFVCFDVLVTDPPYGVNIGSSKESRSGLLVKGAYDIYDDTVDNYISAVVPAVTRCLQLARSKRGAVWGFPPTIWNLPPPSSFGGVFNGGGSGRNKFGWSCFQPVWFYGVAPDLNLGAKPTSISDGSVAEKNGHPCPKPIKWMTWLVDLVSKKDEIIFDPFMGSGTTLRAAKDLGRKAIGCDISEKYCEIAARRMSQEILL